MSDEKIYSQAQVDDIVASSKANLENKLRKNYVEKSEYEKLLNEYSTLRNNIRIKEIKDTYIANKGREAYFNDFMELNKDLFEVDDLSKAFKEKSLKHSWAFMDGADKAKSVESEQDNDDNEEFDLYDYSTYNV